MGNAKHWWRMAGPVGLVFLIFAFSAGLLGNAPMARAERAQTAAFGSKARRVPQAIPQIQLRHRSEDAALPLRSTMAATGTGQFNAPSSGSFQYSALTDQIVGVANGLLVPARALGFVGVVVAIGLIIAGAVGFEARTKVNPWVVVVCMIILGILPDAVRFGTSV